MASRFKFTPGNTDKHGHTHGLVNVYERETGKHLGMLNPERDGGYVLRDREGERLSVRYSGFDDVTYVSRETAAAILGQRMQKIQEITERRAASVTANCPNTWHNGSTYKQVRPCPDCPSQIGLKLALATIENLINVRWGDEGSLVDAREELRAMIYEG
jgi:hypothetical protein